MKPKHFLLSLFILFNFGLQAQIVPTSSPYLDYGNFTVVADSNMTDINVPLLMYRPSVVGTYPVFIFQLGANGFGSSVINRHTYDLFMHHLASYGVVVIIIDDSQAGFPSGTSFTQAHNWFKQKCQDGQHWLSTYANPQKVVIGGHSNGGVNASALLVNRPTEIKGIVFFDSYPSPGVMGIGAHNVSGYTGKMLCMAADENNPDTYKTTFNSFAASPCKTFINIAELDHGGFGDYVNASQPVGSIGRDNATATIRHFLVSWFLSCFHDDTQAGNHFSNASLQPNTTKEFLSNCFSTTNVQEKMMNINIYPNPTSEYVIIENVFNQSLIQILDYQGKIIYERMSLDFKTIINIQDFNPGIFFIKIEDKQNNQSIFRKIIKN